MPYYDPQRDPDPQDWLDQDEEERVEAAVTFHRIKGLEAPNARMHAVIHATVETQLAQEQPEVVAALERLRAGGMDRHDAIHAIGQVLAKTLYGVARSATPNDPNRAYFEALKTLTASKRR